MKKLSAARKSIFEAYDYWLTSFRNIQATRPVAEQLGTFAIAPGDTFEIRTPLPRDASAQDLPAEIFCVVFKDRTGDGERAAIDQLNEHWAGRLFARSAFMPRLRAGAATPDSDIALAVAKLADELQKEAPATEMPERSAQFVEGVQMERSWVRSSIRADLRQLINLQKGQSRVRQAIVEFAEKLDRQ